MLRRLLVVALSLALVGGLSACGNKKDKTLDATTEGPYIDIGELQYQVEISRELNPAAVEDSQFLKGVTERLGPRDLWFGVFVRVQNSSDKAQQPATQFEVVDTEGTVFHPVALPTSINLFAYDPVHVPGKGVIPNANAAAAQNSINGELLLFKIPNVNLDNRPLELKIHNPDDFQQVGTVDLDV